MKGQYSVQIHQGSKDSSMKSSSSDSYASSGTSSPRSGSPSSINSVDKHSVSVHNLGRTGFDPSSPSPQYGGAYHKS